LALVAALVLSCNNPFLDSLLGSPLGAAASGLNISFSGGDPEATYYIRVYDTLGDNILSLDDIDVYGYTLIIPEVELPDGGGTLPDAPLLTGDYYVVVEDDFYNEILGGLVPFDNGNADFDLFDLELLELL
jgi:hypothetical protein